MPNSNGHYPPGQDPDEGRQMPRRPARKKHNRTQQYMMLGAFVLAAILLVVCLIMIVQAIFSKPKTTVPSSAAVSSGVSGSVSGSGDTSTPPVAPGNSADPLLRIVSPAQPLAEEPGQPEGSVVRTLTEGSAVYSFDSAVVDPLKQMMQDCNAAGHNLNIVSGWRSYNAQKRQYDYYTQVFGGDTAKAALVEPPPGQSEHHTGLAVDFISGNGNTQQAESSFAQSGEYQWLVENAKNYGFILRYPQGKEAVTGQDYQPYHWRYVGVDAAKAITDGGLTLEEYVGQGGTA